MAAAQVKRPYIGLNSPYGWKGWGGIQSEDHLQQLLDHNKELKPCSCKGCGAPLLRPETHHWHAKCDDCKQALKKEQDADYYLRVQKARRRRQRQ